MKIPQLTKIFGREETLCAWTLQQILQSLFIQLFLVIITMEDAENTIFTQIRLLKNFFAEEVDEECINIEEIAKSEYEKELEDIQNFVLEIAADIIGLPREHNTRMQTQRKEWW